MTYTQRLKKAAERFLALKPKVGGGKALYQAIKEFDVQKTDLSAELTRRRNTKHSSKPAAAPQPAKSVGPPKKAQSEFNFDEDIKMMAKSISGDSCFIYEINDARHYSPQHLKIAKTLSGHETGSGIVIPEKTIYRLLEVLNSKDMPQISVYDDVIHLTWDSGQELDLYFDQ